MSIAQVSAFQEAIRTGIPTTLPPAKPLDPLVPHAPRRIIEGVLSSAERVLAVQNALRYFPPAWHETLAVEFAEELERYGRTTCTAFGRIIPCTPARWQNTLRAVRKQQRLC